MRQAEAVRRGYRHKNLLFWLGPDRIVYGTGKIVAPAAMAEAAREMFGNARVAYIHVRSASNNCYQARIDRT